MTDPHLVTFTSKDLQTFGLTPKKDPKLGYSFYLWDNMFTTSGTGMPRPNYTVQETAKLFFGKGSDWLRWRYRANEHFPDGYFILGGVKLEPKRTDKANRYYTLADIERMGYALVENNAIDPEHLVLVIQLVLLQARLYRVIGEPGEDE